MRVVFLRLICLSGAVLVAGAAYPCTAFQQTVGGKRMIAKSYDWSMGQGVVLVNRRGVAKRAVALSARDRPARWISKHASVTFNQYGREFPNGGMNEAGLVVEVLWLKSSVYPAPDTRPTVSELQWIQYQLDSFATTKEVVAHTKELRVSPAYAKVHYFVCDASGECAVVEFVGGKTVVTHGDAMVVAAITNNTYAASARYLKRRAKKREARRKATTSLDRFERAARAARVGEGTDHAGAFAVLDAVSLGDYSKWNLVYLPEDLRVYFRTRDSRGIKYVDLKSFELECGTPVRGLDIDIAGEGNVSERFTEFGEKENGRLVRRSLASIEENLPPGTVEQLTRYPGLLACVPAN